MQDSIRTSNNLKPFAWIALGSNVGDSIALIRHAMAQLENLSPEAMIQSSLWKTKPLDCPPDSPDFINAVVRITPSPSETPESLLAKLHTIERNFGRAPKKIWNEPRFLDLDLIAFGAERRSGPDLTLPHPRATERRFVIEPLAEIAPELILPGERRTIAQIAEDHRQHTRQEVERLPSNLDY